MTHDELLAKLDKEIALQKQYLDSSFYFNKKPYEIQLSFLLALRAVVELIQKKQKFLENTKGDIPMTNQQLGAREERTKLLAEIKQAIEKELG